MNETIYAHTTSWEQVARDLKLSDELVAAGDEQVAGLDPGPVIVTITDDQVMIVADPHVGETAEESTARCEKDARDAALNRLQQETDLRDLAATLAPPPDPLVDLQREVTEAELRARLAELTGGVQ